MHADARNLLWDARQAAERVVRFTHGKTFADYQTDEYSLRGSASSRSSARPSISSVVSIPLGNLKSRNFVTPADAGVQTDLKALDSSWRREQIS